MPLLFLTARSSESDRVTGFEIGGDDYVVEPFSLTELALRVAAMPKRGRPRSETATALRAWIVGSSRLGLDPDAHRAVAEWKIPDHLATAAGMMISRQRLFEACFDYVAGGSERTIDTHVKNLRAKLGAETWIETVRGFGYRFAGKAG